MRTGRFTYTPERRLGLLLPRSRIAANGNPAITAAACALVSLNAPNNAPSTIAVGNKTYTSTATSLSIKPSGILSKLWDSCTVTLANPCHDTDPNGFPLSVATSTGNAPVPSAGLTLSVDPNGGFNASVATAGTYSFTYKAQNSQGTTSASSATVTVIFPAPSGLVVTVQDGKTGAAVPDYRWVIEEDRTFYVDPKCTSNPPAAGCPTASSGIVPTFGTNFHTSYMPLVATGCVGPTGAIACETGQTIFDPATGAHLPAVCDIGNGALAGPMGSQQAPLDPSQVHLDPAQALLHLGSSGRCRELVRERERLFEQSNSELRPWHGRRSD